MVPSLLCCVSPASADSLTHTHTHYTHSVHTTQMQTLQLYICDAGKYATTRRQLQPWPALQHSQRSVHFLWDPRESPHCWPCTHRISQPQKKNKNNERFQSWQLMFTWIFSMQEAGMQPVSPELQREPSHQCLLLLSRIKKLSPAAKCIELGSADRKAQRDRYMLVLYV